MTLNSYIGSAVAKPEANWDRAGHSDPLLQLFRTLPLAETAINWIQTRT